MHGAASLDFLWSQAVGRDVESIFVEELGSEISKREMFNILVVDPMMGAIDVDWRDFFPYLKWVPNKALEKRITQMLERKVAVTRALINEQRRRIASGEVLFSSASIVAPSIFSGSFRT